ncbi:polyketide cyclase / dehydrase and lipid transport [Actinocatenispora rupis]|uniref:polyketide cyclase / dehydrase and lipid transport n=1 Tax=Actinocatenispora rupis TaxID=519421 RepID=UPI001940EE53|nr:polyketide cyclase / dehydrase and lipid transport [Actinocatenispora rupis]
MDVLQEMFVAAPPRRVADRLADPAVPAALWPDLTVTVTERRGDEGRRYAVDGAWRGTAELWLEPCADGVLVHAYLRVDRAAGVPSAAACGREWRRRDAAMRRALWPYKDELEADRSPGDPVAPRPRAHAE